MQGRKLVNGSLGDSPALRLTSEGDEDISMWNGGDADDLSLELLTDVDEELDEDVSTYLVLYLADI